MQIEEKRPDMSAIIMEAQLAKALAADATLGRLRVSATSSPGDGVAIAVRGTVVGVWRWRNGMFAFTPSEATRPAASLETIAEAVYETRERFAAP